MKIGLALEGLLVDIEHEFKVWKQKQQGGASSYLDPVVVRDETFWATLKPQYNLAFLNELGITHVLTERPPKLLLATRSWLRRNGLHIQDENIVTRSTGMLKRYDCRLYQLDYFIDSDFQVLRQFTHDKCIPICIGSNDLWWPEWLHHYETLEEVRLEPDKRDWTLWNDEAMQKNGNDEHL